MHLYVLKGFVKIFINRTIPDVRHVNRDGFLPDIEIIQYGSKNATLLSVAVCQRVSDNIEGPMTTYEDHSFPFNLLALVDVSIILVSKYYVTVTLGCANQE